MGIDCGLKSHALHCDLHAVTSLFTATSSSRAADHYRTAVSQVKVTKRQLSNPLVQNG